MFTKMLEAPDAKLMIVAVHIAYQSNLIRKRSVIELPDDDVQALYV